MNPAHSNPSPKIFVTALMVYEGKGRKQEKVYLKYKCPKAGCSRPITEFLKATGFNNPHRHLLRCYVKNVPQITLIGVSPLPKIEEDGLSSLSEEATNFNSETHLKYFRDIFQFYGADFNDRVVCLIGDNVSTNRNISIICNRPHVGCVSHKLNLKVALMFQHDRQLRTTIEGVHLAMKAARTKLKSAAVLRNLARLRPILIATKMPRELTVLCHVPWSTGHALVSVN